LLQQISTNSNNHNNNNKTSSTTPVLSSLQQLLVHENADIAVSVISVIGDWLDPQVIEDVDEDDEAEGGGAQDEVASHLFRLAYWLVVQSGDSHNNTDDSSSSSNPSGWDYIVSNLGRLSIEDDDDDVVVDGEENEDFQGVQTILNLTEQLLELDVLRLATAAADVTEGGSPMRIPPSWVPYMMKQSSSSLLSWLLGLLHDALEKTDSDTNPIVGRALEILSSLAQREEIYTVHPDWTHLPTFRSMFDDEEEEHGDNKPMAKKQKKNPNGDDNDSSSPTKEELNGIEIMLQMIAPFRKRNPSTDTQLDWLENTCLTLASALTFSPIHHLPYFLEAQGIELILRCLKEQVHAGGVGLKLLDFHLPVSTATSSAKAQELDSQAQCACEHLVKAGGFKFVFPLFMGRSLPRRAQIGPSDAAATSTASKRQEREWNQMIQDQIIRILYALSRYLTDASPDDAKARFLSKFVEAGMEKCDRLVDLTLRYDQKTRQAEYRFYRNTDVDNDEEEEEMDDTAALQAKLQGGGDLFYCLCAICAFCCVGSKRCHERIVEQLESRQSGLSLIQTGLQEFVSVLDDGSQKDQVQFYLTTLF
jgi:beta-catenin-like protein 1